MFHKKSKENHAGRQAGIKKLDVLITSVVLGTIIAGAFGLKKKPVEKPQPLWKRILNKYLGRN